MFGSILICQYNYTVHSVYFKLCHSAPDNTASIVARRHQFSQSEQDLYQLPVVVRDGGEPVLSSTSTLNLRVCVCQRGGGGSSRVKACRVPAFLSTAGLSTGAFIAILLCIIILLGKRQERGGDSMVGKRRWERRGKEKEGGREKEEGIEMGRERYSCLCVFSQPLRATLQSWGRGRERDLLALR